MANNQAVRVNGCPATYCNPLDLGYQYQAEFASREAADPAAILFRGDYYLFVSHSSGYWWSEDLADWHFVYVSQEKLPEIGKWAPGVCAVGDTLYLTHSQEGSIYKSRDPKAGEWELVSHPLDWGDPALFTDDDGRVYCYYGCSPRDPIFGVELDPRREMAAVGAPVALIQANPAAHGFEVPGEHNDCPQRDCWLEGAWMSKCGGRYYLQYAVPGTEYAAYADGCYVSDHPLGPFTYCENSPVSRRAGGFAVGTGHGSLLRDKRGNWWKFGTVSISVNHMFERRLTMSPAAFDAHGQLVVNTGLADYPAFCPHAPQFAFDTPRPDWWRLRPVAVTASSALAGHPPALAAEETLRTWWSAATGDAGEWLMMELADGARLRAVQVNFADQDITPVQGRENDFCARYLLEISADGTHWQTLTDTRDAQGAPHTARDRSHPYVELCEETPVKFVRLTGGGAVPAGGRLAVSGLRLFGHGGHAAPAAVDAATARRQADGRVAVFNWDAADGADGYLLRLGCHPDSLYLQEQVAAPAGGAPLAYTLRCLSAGVDYWFAVDSFNDSGYTAGKVQKLT